MKTYHFRRLLMALCSVLLLVSCSSSGGGIGGTGIISRGTVSAHGSIFVNGTEFDTSNAVIMVNGLEVGTGDQFVLDYLDIGKVVLVEGTGDMDDIIAVANRVTYHDNVVGPVESIVDIPPTTKEIVVLGQRVILNVLTKFKETAFDTIAQDDLVEVSGLVDDTGAIRATFLGKTGVFVPGNIVGVTGFIVNLDVDLKIFEINDLTVGYSEIDPGDLPEGFANGLWVEVEGTLDVAGGEMTAESVELGDGMGDGDSDQIEVFGFVTDVVSDFKFTVGNQVVQLDANTEFVDGDPTDILPGVKLEAEGYLEDGILFADEVEFWGPDQIEVEGLVTDIASDSEFTVGDQVVQTDGETVFEPEDLDIVVGMMIEVKGVPVDIEHSILFADKVSFEED
ncbi:DUF5666 domain-containing protein [Thermodesulfobacteriota bacterium]